MPDWAHELEREVNSPCTSSSNLVVFGVPAGFCRICSELSLTNNTCNYHITYVTYIPYIDITIIYVWKLRGVQQFGHPTAINCRWVSWLSTFKVTFFEPDLSQSFKSRHLARRQEGTPCESAQEIPLNYYIYICIIIYIYTVVIHLNLISQIDRHHPSIVVIYNQI